MKRDCHARELKRNPSGLHSGREPPVSQRPITDSKDIARVTGKDFIRRPKRFLHKRKSTFGGPKIDSEKKVSKRDHTTSNGAQIWARSGGSPDPLSALENAATLGKRAKTGSLIGPSNSPKDLFNWAPPALLLGFAFSKQRLRRNYYHCIFNNIFQTDSRFSNAQHFLQVPKFLCNTKKQKDLWRCILPEK